MIDFMKVFNSDSPKKRESLMAALNENGSAPYYVDLMNQCNAPDAFDYPKLFVMITHDYLCSYGGRGGILILPLAKVTDCYVTNLLPKYDFENIGLAVEADGKRYNLAFCLINKKMRAQLEQFLCLIKDRISSNF